MSSNLASAFSEHSHRVTLALEKKKRGQKMDWGELKKDVQMDEHKIGIEELASRHNTTIEVGLTHDSATEKLREDGPNIVTPAKEKNQIFKLLKNFSGFFLVLLLFGAILSIIGFAIDPRQQSNLYIGLVLLLVVIVTGIVTYFQKRQSTDLVNSFKKYLPPLARVLRDGDLVDIKVDELVLGDIIELEKGDMIPADIRIISCSGFKVDNSALTGEKEPQKRTVHQTHENPFETMNLSFFGTTCAEGTARGIVINTGDNTVMGRINQIVQTKDEDTALQTEIHRFVRIISVIGIIIGLTFFIVSVSLKNPVIPSLLYLIGILVASVPEGLLFTVPAGLTLTAKKMSTKSLLVKNMEVIDTLGLTTVICCDKTGILTQSKMQVSRIWIDGTIFDYDSNGKINGTFDNGSPSFSLLYKACTLCNRAFFGSKDNNLPISDRRAFGDSLESAILKFMQLRLDSDKFREANKKVAEIVFNSTNKWQASIHEVEGENRHVLLMKGAPERLAMKCSKILMNGESIPLDEELRKKIISTHGQLASSGDRVLGFAFLRLDTTDFPVGFEFTTEPVNFPMENMTFIGLMGLIDPPRPEVPQAVEMCKRAGIKVIMVTGDHPVTAQAIAKQIGIIDSSSKTKEDIAKENGIPVDRVDMKDVTAVVVSGEDLEEMNEAEWSEVLDKKYIVFARVSPSQKMAIVEKNQNRGETVIVTGDAVSDSPAIKKADIGIAMGIAGTDTVQQAADMILLDDNFASIVNGIEEGRHIFDNLKKSISYSLTSNIPEILPFILYVTIDIPLPLTVALVLCIDIGTDLIPAISLGYEKAESDIMDRKPRHKSEHLVNFKLLSFAYLQIGIMQALSALFVYLIVMGDNGFPPWMLIKQGFDWQEESLMLAGRGFPFRQEVLAKSQSSYFAAIIINQWINLIISKTRKLSLFQHGMGNKWLNFGLLYSTVLGALIIYVPWLHIIFGTRFVDIEHLLLTLPFTFLIFFYDELKKWLIRRSQNGWFAKMYQL